MVTPANPAADPSTSARALRPALNQAQEAARQLARELTIAQARGGPDAQETGRARALELTGRLIRMLDQAVDLTVDDRLAVELTGLTTLTRALAHELTGTRATELGTALRLSLQLIMRIGQVRTLSRRAEQAVAASRRPRVDRWRILRLRALARRVARSRGLSMCLISVGAVVLPSTHRARYQNEWAAELDVLARKQAPLLGFALRTLLWAPLVARALRSAATRRPASARLARVRPGPWVVGSGTAVLTFCTAALELWDDGSPPLWQILMAVAISLLAGSLTGWQEHKRRRDDRDQRGR